MHKEITLKDLYVCLLERNYRVLEVHKWPNGYISIVIESPENAALNQVGVERWDVCTLIQK